MSQQLQLYQQIFSLYNLVKSYIKPTTPELQIALKTLTGLYNQYDIIKDIAYKAILKGLQSNWHKYNYLINEPTINITDIFSIITDRLKDDEVSMNNIKKLQPLSKIPLDDIFVNKVKKIVNNIEKIIKI